MILRNLILEILSDLTHPRWCLSSNNTIVTSAIEQTSYNKYDTPLPGIKDPNITDNDGILTHELVPHSSPPVDSSYCNSQRGVTVKERHGDATDRETTANDSGECFTTPLKGSTHNNPGEQIATTKKWMGGQRQLRKI